jgi:hypothetical protein
MARSQRRAIRSDLVVLLADLLKPSLNPKAPPGAGSAPVLEHALDPEFLPG